MGDIKTSLRYYDELAKLADTNKIPPEKALPLLISRIKIRWSEENAPQRIQAFEDLWATDKYSKVVEILVVGDELLSHYYFTRPINKTKYEKVSEMFFYQSEWISAGLHSARHQGPSQQFRFHTWYGTGHECRLRGVKGRQKGV